MGSDSSCTKNATNAAKAMMSERGYVVIGYPGDRALDPNDDYAGEMVPHFAGQSLCDGMTLKVIGETGRADWDDQFVALFGSGKRDKYAPEPGQRFFRCVLIARDPCEMGSDGATAVGQEGAAK